MIRKPAEWEPLAAVWLSWPHNRQTWPGHHVDRGDRFDAIEPFYAKWVRTIAQSHPVRILAAGPAAASAAKYLKGIGNVDLIDIPTNDAWIRDYGANFVVEDQKLAAVSFRYNAWGGKYPPWEADDAVAAKMADHLGVDVIASGLCGEGGALEFDGRGRLLTTPDCWIDPQRNDPERWDQDSVSREFYRLFGVTEIVWVDGGGIDGDDTDGHIDQGARFIDPENVVVAVADACDTANHSGLEDNWRQLKLWGHQTEPSVTTHRLPIPPPRSNDGQPVPQSYCNFLRLGPDRILVPTFDCDADDHALGLLSELTGVSAEGIDCQDLSWGLGALHCASCEQPAAPPNS